MSRIALVIVGVLLAVMIMEIGLRLYYFGSLASPTEGIAYRQPDPDVGWTLVPNTTAFMCTLDYVVTVRINSHGLHDVEHDYVPTPGTFRIVVLGDSTMEAYQVPLSASFCRVLEEELVQRTGRQIEVINLGVGGYSTTQEYLLFEKEGVRYDPDLVLLSFLPSNDVRNNSRPLELKLWKNVQKYETVARPFLEQDQEGHWILIPPDIEKAMQIYEATQRAVDKRRNERPLLERLLLWTLYRRAHDAARASTEELPYDIDSLYGVYYTTLSPEYCAAWDITREALVRLRDAAEGAGARFAMFVAPGIIEVMDEYWKLVQKGNPEILSRNVDLARAEDVATMIARSEGIPVVGLRDSFREYQQAGQGNLYNMLEDHHWTPEGQRLAAEIVASYLVESGLLE